MPDHRPVPADTPSVPGSADGIEARLAAHVAATRFDAVDPAAIETARRSTLDIAGVSIAGARDPGVATLAGLVTGWGGTGQARAFGVGTALPAPMAALVNGAAARVLDFDDVVDPLGTHPSVAIFPPLLAIAELKPDGVTGRDFLAAMAIGQDLSVRLADARKETLLESGRYDLAKVIAATAAAANLYGLDAARTHHALGIAYTSALGETQCMIDGASTVFYQQGLVASNAVKAVLLAEAGFTGARDFLTGRWGYYSAFEPGSDLDTVTRELGRLWRNVDGIAFKPFPTCRPCVSAAALAIELVEGRRLAPEAVEAITVRTNRQIFDLVCDPMDRKSAPSTVVEARFGLPYNVAVALVEGDLFIDDFTLAALDRAPVVEMARKVRASADPACDHPDLGTHGRIAIEIALADGTTRTGAVERSKGNPQNPMTTDELRAKFLKCLAYAGRTGADRLADRILALGRDPRPVTELTGALFA